MLYRILTERYEHHRQDAVLIERLDKLGCPLKFGPRI